jgi:hypothetical protein
MMSFRRIETKLFALWTVALTIFFGARVVLGQEGDPPTDQDPATIVYPTYSSDSDSYSGGGHSSSSGSGSSFSFGK